MSTRRRRLTVPPMDWVLVANAARARCFERDANNNALRELDGFVHPQSRMKGVDLSDDRGGMVHKGGAASTKFEPHTEVHHKERERFARELAQYLESAALEHRYSGVVLLASSPFLGELKAQLGDATKQLLRASEALDLTSCSGDELERRVTQAMQAAGR